MLSYLQDTLVCFRIIIYPTNHLMFLQLKLFREKNILYLVPGNTSVTHSIHPYASRTFRNGFHRPFA